ncbi:hypothetical protein [Herbaspirillum sp. alder98]|uniref:hypothetical protein n=1 Tax=Herbaspirillum sp. alder98 TaxID=2913096 RepID=UPI001CD8932C|nr:hypothetical protein [Herbaspirillum sp. alder98]MCA1325916.1 hypothetical protein [Herbaspirillum sp. alder98]
MIDQFFMPQAFLGWGVSSSCSNGCVRFRVRSANNGKFFEIMDERVRDDYLGNALQLLIRQFPLFLQETKTAPEGAVD